jgi:hypothetical protein
VFPNLVMILGIYIVASFLSHKVMVARRPDYQKLHVLRQLFPRVPIMALSATCPPMVLEDIIKTMRMKPVVNGSGQFT